MKNTKNNDLNVINSTNAVLETYRSGENGKYINLRVTIPTRDNGSINFIAIPLCKDKKTLAKLLYKIEQSCK